MKLRGIQFSIFGVVLFLLVCAEANGQQLLIMKKGKIVSRFEQGDDLLFVMKNEKQLNHVTIQSLREFYLITTARDTIKYQQIGRIKFRNPQKRKYGVTTFASGAALLGIWAINSLAFDPNSQSMRGLRFVGLLGVGVGIFIFFTADSSVKLNGIRRLKYISYDSPLYK
jgi:hypothetical protein